MVVSINLDWNGLESKGDEKVETVSIGKYFKKFLSTGEQNNGAEDDKC